MSDKKDKEKVKKEKKEEKLKEEKLRKESVKGKNYKDKHDQEEEQRKAAAARSRVVSFGTPKESDSSSEKSSMGKAAGIEMKTSIPGHLQGDSLGTIDMSEDLHRLWNRGFLQTSTVKDIGRLAKGLEIIDERKGPSVPGTVLYHGSEETLPRLVYSIILSLAKALEPTVVASVEGHYWKFVHDKQSSDLTGQLVHFFGPQSGLNWSEDCKVLRVLKAVNQEFLAPPVLKMKLEIHRHLQYKDLRGGWTVQIFLKPGGEVVVIHNKQEQSHDAASENHFEFTWNLIIHFNADTSDFTCNFQILNYTFGEKTSRARQNEVKKILEPFVVPELPYRHIISRPQSNLGNELVRFCKTLEISDDREGVRLYSYNAAAGQIKNLRDIVDCLVANTQPELAKPVEENFSKLVVGDPMTIQAFISSGAIPEDSKVMRILKCIHQEICSPAVLKLRSELHEQIPYKDVKGTWMVHIAFTSTDICISHCKREQSASPTPEDFFEFEWRLRLQYDRATVSSLRVAFHIVSFTFGDRTSPAIRQRWLDLARAYFTPDTHELATVSVSVSELLNSAILALAALPAPGPVATLPSVRAPVCVADMLKRLDRALTSLPQQLPAVSISVPRKAS